MKADYLFIFELPAHILGNRHADEIAKIVGEAGHVNCQFCSMSFWAIL